MEEKKVLNDYRRRIATATKNRLKKHLDGVSCNVRQQSGEETSRKTESIGLKSIFSAISFCYLICIHCIPETWIEFIIILFI